MTDNEGEQRRKSSAVVLGGSSVAFWFCCPFWMLTWLLALPAGLAGVVLGYVQYRAASREGLSRTRPITGMALGAVGTFAAVAYLIFLVRHPDLDIQ
ncbi:hypothetical protein ACIBL8_18580 [Streptomyces sp. NPDC050523]|uniref:hypothetical protein n=1 Tax=Streptomyces sp. NPDC050523 TaxID=3365622 RepID=UPI0037AAE612